MPVTDIQVATLRALLMQEFDESRRLMEQISQDGMRNGYFPLLGCAFVNAVKDRFRGKKPRDVIDWTAELRAQRDPADQIDPDVSERLLLSVFGKASIDDLDFDTEYGHRTLILGFLVEEAGLEDADLDAFLQKARDDTDEALERRAGN